MIISASFLADGRRQKIFYGRVNPNKFEGRRIKLTSTVKEPINSGEHRFALGDPKQNVFQRKSW